MQSSTYVHISTVALSVWSAPSLRVGSAQHDTMHISEPPVRFGKYVGHLTGGGGLQRYWVGQFLKTMQYKTRNERKQAFAEANRLAAEVRSQGGVDNEVAKGIAKCGTVAHAAGGRSFGQRGTKRIGGGPHSTPTQCADPTAHPREAPRTPHPHHSRQSPHAEVINPNTINTRHQ